MSNLMSKFRKKVTINIVDIFRFHIRRERGVDVVCHRASGRMPHVLLTVFFRHADDIEVRRKSVTQRVDVYIVINACRGVRLLQPDPKFFAVKAGKF